MTTNDDWNKAYFGKPVLPPDILVRATVSNKDAAPLLSAIAAATVAP